MMFTLWETNTTMTVTDTKRYGGLFMLDYPDCHCITLLSLYILVNSGSSKSGQIVNNMDKI